MAPSLPHTPSRKGRDRDREGSSRETTAPPSLLGSPMRLNTSVQPTSGSPSPSSAGGNKPSLSVDIGSRDKRLPSLPSPLAGRGKDWALGAYDNKLVSSTLSHLPPIPPLSPSGMSSTGSNLSSFSHASTSPHTNPHAMTAPAARSSPSFISLPRPTPPPPSAGGVLVLPDGTALPTGENGGRPERVEPPSISHAMAHSSPHSPWSLLTVHVLPLFAGSPLKTPLEDLNNLCNSHIVATSQRTPASRLIGALTADLRDFIASGMLTLKAKFDAIDDAKVVSRASEVWSFFWGQILPYVEGVFLPLSQVRDVPTSATARRHPTTVASPPIAVRYILLSGFLVHILLPLLPRLVPLVAALPAPGDAGAAPGATDLPRLLQMSLVLSTQARYSAFYTPRDPVEAEAHDRETSEGVQELGRAVRWAIVVVGGEEPQPGVPAAAAAAGNQSEKPDVREHEHQLSGDGKLGVPKRPGLARAPSLSQAGRLRARPRASGSISALEPELQGPGGTWAATNGGGGGGRIDEDADAEARAAGHYASLAPSTATLRGDSVATLTDRTPTAPVPAAAAAAVAQQPRRRPRTYSSGESDLTTVSSVFSAAGRR